MSKLDEWKKLCERAIKGPWITEVGNICYRVRYSYHSYETGNEESDFIGEVELNNKCAEYGRNEALFIAEARTAMPVLIECLEELMEECDAPMYSSYGLPQLVEKIKAKLEQV